jgi:hypothetical protein
MVIVKIVCVEKASYTTRFVADVIATTEGRITATVVGHTNDNVHVGDVVEVGEVFEKRRSPVTFPLKIDGMSAVYIVDWKRYNPAHPLGWTPERKAAAILSGEIKPEIAY